MAYLKANIDPMKFPGAAKVTEHPFGFMAYGPEVDGMHEAIGLICVDKAGGYVIETDKAVQGATPITAVEAATKVEIYETIVKTKRSPYIARKIGLKPTGPTYYGHEVVSTKPAVGWTLEKLRKMERQIAEPKAEQIGEIEP